MPSTWSNSSLSPVLLLRWRLNSVADVLEEIRNNGFTQSWWEALLRFWHAVCRRGPCGPICSFHPWHGWADLLGFKKWVFDSLDVLNDFTRQVVVSRRDNGIRKWASWLREDSGSRPYVWLRPDFLPPLPFLVIKNPLNELVLLLLLRLAMSLTGGLLLTFQFSLAFVFVPGWLMLLARLLVSLFGLRVG